VRVQCVSFELYFLDNKLSYLLPLCITAGELYTLGVYRHQKCDLPGSGNVLVQQSNTRATSSSHDRSSSLSMLETVPFIDGEHVVQIASGTEHSALVTGKSFLERLEMRM
jgi:secretion-regulating guanine nucleotide exchange factor